MQTTTKNIYKKKSSVQEQQQVHINITILFQTVNNNFTIRFSRTKIIHFFLFLIRMHLKNCYNKNGQTQLFDEQ